jgi:hypothetical protein
MYPQRPCNEPWRDRPHGQPLEPLPACTGKDFLAGVKSIRVTLKRALITGPKPNKLMISSAPRPFANLSSWAEGETEGIDRAPSPKVR